MLRSLGSVGRRFGRGVGSSSRHLASAPPAAPRAAASAPSSAATPPPVAPRRPFPAIPVALLVTLAGGAYYYSSLDEEKRAELLDLVRSPTPAPQAKLSTEPPPRKPAQVVAAPAPAPPPKPAPVASPAVASAVATPAAAPAAPPAPAPMPASQALAAAEEDLEVLHQAALVAMALVAANPPAAPEEPAPTVPAATSAPAPADAASSTPVTEAPTPQPTEPATVAPVQPHVAAAAAEPSSESAAGGAVPALSSAAQAASTAWAMAKISDVLRQDAAADGLAEVAGLSEQELRERVLRLNVEMQQRAKWEAVRLADAISQNEAQWLAQFDDFAARAQAQALQDAQAAVEKARVAMEEEMGRLVDSARLRIAEELTDQANAKLRAAQQEFMSRVGTETARRLEALDALRAETGATEALLQAREEYERRARRVQKVALATLALLQRSSVGGPCTQEVAALQVAGGDDDVIARAVRLLPRAAHSASGVPTTQELQARFVTVARAARRAAVTPPNSGVLGHAVGVATAALLVPTPSQSLAPPAAPHSSSSSGSFAATALGLLPAWVRQQIALPAAAVPPPPSSVAPAAQGVIDQAITSAKAAAAAAEEVSAELQRVATVIDAAQARIDSGDLSGALEALRPGLDGTAAAAAADWCAAAEDRVALDDATTLARARAAVLAASVW